MRLIDPDLVATARYNWVADLQGNCGLDLSGHDSGLKVQLVVLGGFNQEIG